MVPGDTRLKFPCAEAATTPWHGFAGCRYRERPPRLSCLGAVEQSPTALTPLPSSTKLCILRKGQMFCAMLCLCGDQLRSDDWRQLPAVIHQLRGLSWAGHYTYMDQENLTPVGNMSVPHFQNYYIFQPTRTLSLTNTLPVKTKTYLAKYLVKPLAWSYPPSHLASFILSQYLQI